MGAEMPDLNILLVRDITVEISAITNSEGSDGLFEVRQCEKGTRLEDATKAKPLQKAPDC